MIPALATITLAAFVARLVIREHQRELRVGQALLVTDMRADDRAAEVAGDVLAREKRQDAANAIAFEVRAAFLSQMTPEQQLRAELDRDDAVARIAGWGL